MRRLSILVVIAAAGTLFSLATLAAIGLGVCSQRPNAAALLLPAAANAQQVMQFKSVPAESAAAEERRRSRRAARDRDPDPDPQVDVAIPVPPNAPEPPSVPEPPEEVDRSGDVVRFGSDIRIREGQNVSGDVVAMGGDVTVNGHVEGDVVAMGGDVFLGATGKVDGQVVTLGGQLHEEPGSHVGGQRVTAGGLSKRWKGWPFLGVMGIVGSGLKALFAIAKMVVVLLIAWGFTQLAPQRTQVAFDAFRNQPLKSLGVGLLAWALIIPSIVALALVVAILCITIIGIPLAIAVAIGYVFGMIVLAVWGYVVGAAVLGERLSRQLGRTASSLTLMAVWGIVALTAIKVVGHLFGGLPMGGGAGGMLILLATLIGAALTTMGAGALLTTQLRRDQIARWWPGARGHVPPAA
ncbi:MAG TPA: polymer-forming cytoskeletal protein, partial [Candidatus Eisenbacteria bacterium]|nr:polymer-forming cytoskeletal protein [Candidatus Eisenbacteria bacterium]